MFTVFSALQVLPWIFQRPTPLMTRLRPPTLLIKVLLTIALMALKVIAADGRRNVGEMEKFNEAIEAIDIAPETVHRAFDRYFAETMPKS